MKKLDLTDFSYTDSMPFDFVFAFRKGNNSVRMRAPSTPKSRSMTNEAVNFLREKLSMVVEDKKTEKDFRLDTYPHMIKLVNEAEEGVARKLAERYEEFVKSQSDYFGKIGKKS
ncbi:MAG: hypothetical protein ACXQTS_05800 [Candidatus Methanospirareceae archaeon]